MTKQVVMTVSDRPHYLAETLRSLAGCDGVDGWRLAAFCEPGCPEAVALLETVDFMPVEVTVHPERLKANTNTWRAMEAGFAAAYRVVMVEEDTPVASDTLTMFDFAFDRWADDPTVGAVTAFRHGRWAGDVHELVVAEGLWGPWVWGTWKDRWERWFRSDWDYDYGLGGWDVHLGAVLDRHELATVAPAAWSRSTHIGEFGLHFRGPEDVKHHHVDVWRPTYPPGGFGVDTHPKPLISVLLPSRGRPGPLEKSIRALVATADDPSRVEVLVGCDDDDTSMAGFNLDLGCRVRVRVGERHGYANLHRYINDLFWRARGDWLLLWNDDAVMTSPGWDTVVDGYGTQMVVLNPRGNMGAVEHECMFPIFPSRMAETMGCVSEASHFDTWVQDVANELGIMVDVDTIRMVHERADLTGDNDDETFAGRVMTHDVFHSPEMTAARRQAADRVRVRDLGLPSDRL